VREIADSGLLIALLDRRDAHHAWARQVCETIEPPFVTCGAVVAEVSVKTRAADKVLALIEAGDVLVDFDLNKEAGAIRRLLRKYADQPMDFADACVVRMSELTPLCRIFTTDRRDFSVYRRNGRQPVPCVFPH
jgi:uncharacterized protein